MKFTENLYFVFSSQGKLVSRDHQAHKETVECQEVEDHLARMDNQGNLVPEVSCAWHPILTPIY